MEKCLPDSKRPAPAYDKFLMVLDNLQNSYFDIKIMSFFFLFLFLRCQVDVKFCEIFCYPKTFVRTTELEGETILTPTMP